MLVLTPVRHSILALAASEPAVSDGSQSNNMHSDRLRRSHQYLRVALNHLSRKSNDDVEDVQVVPHLFARILVAYYHHSITSHAAFRCAVLETLKFVRLHLDIILDSAYGNEVLQLWYRLYLSCRPSKLPNLPLEHEEASEVYPNLSTMSLDDRIHFACHQNQSTNDLIYSILTKTIELRSRMIMNDCVATMHNVSAGDPQICRIVGHVLNLKMTQQTRRVRLNVESKADSGFVAGEHLAALLAIQEEKLHVWESRICQEHHIYTSNCHTSVSSRGAGESSSYRRAMNSLYCTLCKLIFAELLSPKERRVSPNRQPNALRMSVHALSNGIGSSIVTCPEVPALLRQLFRVISELDLAKSAVEDRYSFGLTEVLRQLCYSWQDESLYFEILKVVWPRIEQHGHSFRHCHLPAHLAKKWISFMYQEYIQGKRIVFGTNAMHESTPRAEFLKTQQQALQVLVCGYTTHSVPFLELKQL